MLFFAALISMVAVGAWLRIGSLQEDAAEVQPATRVVQSAGPAAAVSTQRKPAIASGDVSAARAQRTAAAERERRYRELLNSSPPPPPRRLPPPPTLDRSGPRAESVGAERNRSAAAPVARPAAATTTPTRRSPAPRAPHTTAKTRVSTAPATEQDPDTDIRPPQLISAEFLPPQVTDGEETVFTATIEDDLSGVRSAYGVIVSPSGSEHPFFAVAGGGDYFSARVKVPRDAPAGVWAVRDLTLTDNAANATRLTRSHRALRSTAFFRVVSSSSDESGPQLKSVWLDRPAMRAGERNTLFVQAEDNKAGVAEVSCLFVSPAKSARMLFECPAAEGGTWRCPVAVPRCVDCGAWRLEQVRLRDNAGNRTTFRRDHAAVSNVALHLSGDQCDSAAPTITTLSVNPVVVSNARANTIEFRAIVEDEGACGVASVSAEAVPPRRVGGQEHRITFKPLGDGVTYIGTLDLQQAAVKGQWTISWIRLSDRGNNLRTYSAKDPVTARGAFRVE